MIGLLASIKSGITTLTSRLTSTRAGYLDNLDAAVTTRAASATALSSATWTGTRAGYLDKIGIRSIEQGSVTISTGAESGTATLSTTLTDVNKALVIYRGALCNAKGVDAMVALTNTTTVTANCERHDGTTTTAVYVYFTVIEFMG